MLTLFFEKNLDMKILVLAFSYSCIYNTFSYIAQEMELRKNVRQTVYVQRVKRAKVDMKLTDAHTTQMILQRW